MNVNNDTKTIINSVEKFTGSECRVCLAKCNEVWEIFHPTNLDIRQKMMEFAAVQIEVGDGLPTIICHNCRRLLDVSYEFKLQVEKSDAKLRQAFMLKIPNDETAKILSMNVDAAITEAIVDEMTQGHCNDMVNCVELQNHLGVQENGIVTELNDQHYAHHEPIIFRIEPPPHDPCIMEQNIIESEICNDAKRIAMNCEDNRAVDALLDKYEGLGASSITNGYKSEPMLTSESELSETEINENREICERNELIVCRMKNESTKDCFAKIENEMIQDDFVDELENNIIRHDAFSSVDNTNIKETTIIEDNKNDCKDEEVKAEAQLSESDEERPLSVRTRRLKCTQCIKTFSTKISLERHAEIHANKTKLRRYKQFSSLTKLKNQECNLSNEETNREEIVNEATRQRGEKRLSRNYAKRGTKFICKICGKQFTYQKPFLTHARIHSDYKPELIVEKGENVVATVSDESNERGRESENEDDEDDDYNDEEDDEEDDLPIEGLQCTQCGKLFATKRNLKRHISTHSGLKFHCSTCSKEFSRIDKLKEHEQSKHKDEFFASTDTDSDDETDNEGKNHDGRKKEKINRPHKCPMCPKAFAQEQSLTNHMERHKRVKDTQKRFLCEVCSKCFAQSGSLVAHMRTHTGVKPYVCNVCTRAFTKGTYLQLHLRTHSGEKPYICQYCSRAFARANTLARHITMHTGEAKYHCQICTKSFRRLTSLNEHTYTHTGQRPYACKICTKRYNNAGSLYAHTKKCKNSQQSDPTTTFNVLPINDEPIIHQELNDHQQTMIYTQRKLNDDITIEQLPPSSQFIISSNSSTTLKTMTNNGIPQFTVEEPNFCNLKSYKNNSYYTIYPANM